MIIYKTMEENVFTVISVMLVEEFLMKTGVSVTVVELIVQ